MLDLEATLPDGSLRRLKVTAPTIVGRDVPGGGADFAIPDDEVSRKHAELRAEGDAVRVTRLESAKNPIHHVPLEGKAIEIAKGQSFLLRPGERFSLGGTSIGFAVKREPHTETLAATVSRQQLRQVPFLNPHAPMQALQALPGLVRCRDREELDAKILEAALHGVPAANVAAMVLLPREPDSRPVSLQVKTRNHISDESPPSASIVRKALSDQLDSFLHVWHAGSDFHATKAIGSDWALCVPLPDDQRGQHALYLTGPMPGTDLGALKDAQKFTDLLGEMYKATTDLRALERQLGQTQCFLPSKLRAEIASHNLEDKLKPRKAIVTVLFCDLRGSCGAAEGDDLLANWDKIGDALEAMTAEVTDEEGVIGDFQGDAVMAFWGWPEDDDPEDQIKRAVKAARNIQRRFLSIRTRNRGSLHCGIGLAHGEAVAGRLGSVDQSKLGVFGPVVNLAARLESLTKHFGVSILADEAILKHLEKSKTPFRPLPRIRPAGMAKGMQLCEVSPPDEDMAYRDATRATLWKNALDAFTAKDWPRAVAFLAKYRQVIGKADRPSAVLEEFMAKVDAATWDGVIAMEKK